MRDLRVLVALTLPLLGTLGTLGTACSKSSDGNPANTSGDAGVDTGSYPKDPIDDVAVTETVSLTGLKDGLKEPVRIVRDKRGMVHVYARNLHDAGLAQGFIVARDRAPQLEIFRRLAEGRLAEYAGNLQPSLADRDLFFRAMGLRRVAEKYYATLKEGSDAKVILDAYAVGVSAYFAQIRDGSAHVPNGWLAIPRKKYLDWDPIASLAIARLQTWSLSWNGDAELSDTELFDAARSTFKADATDDALKARAGFAIDVLRWEPPAKVAVLSTPPPPAMLVFPETPRVPSTKLAHFPHLSADTLSQAKPSLAAARSAADQVFGHRGALGSNNFVIAPGKSVTGKSLVASDPHLALKAPAIFHMAALHVIDSDPAKAIDIAGMSFAGIPGVVLGFTKSIAWGATVSEFDVQDLYQDHVAADGTVMVGGKRVAIEKVTEPFDYGDGHPQPITFEFVPGHGVILPTIVNDKLVARTATDVISYRWTGLEPTGEFEAFVGLTHAKNVDEARAAMEPFQVGSQNFVFGDSSGNILYTTHAWVPKRPKGAFTWDPKTHDGLAPCLVLPGDQSLEWTGKVDDKQLPQARNPKENYIATANSDQYGLSFDNDPTNDAVYLTCSWDPGFREARLHQRLDEKDKLGLDDLASVQADAKSPLGARIAKFFVAAMQRAEDARTGKTPAADLDALVKDPKYDAPKMQLALSLLTKWADAQYDTPAAVQVSGDPAPTPADIAASEATSIFNAAMIPLFGYVFDDEFKAMSAGFHTEYAMKGLLRMLEKPEPLATADASGESVLWDDLSTKTIVETKDERMVRAMIDGLAFLKKTLGDDVDGWRWGKLHTVRFDTLVSGTESTLSIPNTGDSRFPAGGFPRHGDEYVVDASQFGLGGGSHSFDFGYTDGPAQRFVANLEDGKLAIKNALPGGNVWIPDSPHFDDEAQLWRKNQNAPIVFSPGEVSGDAEERIDLTP